MNLPKVKQLIPAFTKNPNSSDTKDALCVSEFFYDTIQGEGIYTGQPAVFLRLKGCTLNCTWCDTTEVWRQGSYWSYEQLFQLMKKNDVHKRLEDGHHLVITGGSPLMQQKELIDFLYSYDDYFGFHPFIEIENECVIKPLEDLLLIVECLNNSPKLENSGNSLIGRYKPDVIKATAVHDNSWFKFVISDPLKDFDEIKKNFIEPELIRREQIILMPNGSTKTAIEQNTPAVIELAIKYGVQFSTRLHILIWNNAVGV